MMFEMPITMNTVAIIIIIIIIIYMPVYAWEPVARVRRQGAGMCYDT